MFPQLCWNLISDAKNLSFHTYKNVKSRILIHKGNSENVLFDFTL